MESNNISKFLPKSEKEVVFVYPTQNYHDIKIRSVDGEPNICLIIPYHDKNMDVPLSVFNTLRNTKAIGWDYLPENLTTDSWSPEYQKRKEKLVVYKTSSSMYPQDVIKELEKQGFKVKTVKANATELAEILAKKQDSENKIGVERENPRNFGITDYEKARALWALHHKDFTDWEKSFVESIGKWLKAGKSLSPKQKDAFNKLLKKYKIIDNKDLIVEVNKKLVNKSKP